MNNQTGFDDILTRAVTHSSHPPPPRYNGFDPTSVMALVGFNPEPYLLFIEKADVKGYPWANHMAFPGGHCDPGDNSRLDTALRELEEEMGISKDHVRMIGSLGHFQTINNKDIEAFIGIWDQEEKINYDTEEISRFFEIPIRHLMETHRKKCLNGRDPDFHELEYPFKDIVIWGATAKIIHHFLEIISNGIRPDEIGSEGVSSDEIRPSWNAGSF